MTMARWVCSKAATAGESELDVQQYDCTILGVCDDVMHHGTCDKKLCMNIYAVPFKPGKPGAGAFALVSDQRKLFVPGYIRDVHNSECNICENGIIKLKGKTV